VPISGFAALQALRDVGQVQAGHEVLVIGAAGGVGSFAVQLAKAFGAQVTGVCAPPPRSSWSARSAPTAWSTTPAGMSPTGRATGI
jgi:NADPH:quinone reductase-like Zn-dependent oxidoreductase